MPTSYKVLAQGLTTADTSTTLYTVPSSTQAVVSTITVTNLQSSPANYSMRIKVSNAANDDKQLLFVDNPLSGSETNVISAGISLATGDVVAISGTTSLISINLYGSEIS
jgi:hypothetical protein